jgi:hypothetical protein
MPTHRRGGKFDGEQTEVIEFVGIIGDLISPLPSVARISFGNIRHAPGRGSSVRKIIKLKKDGNAIVLIVVENRSAQELRAHDAGQGTLALDVKRALAKARLPFDE